MTLNFISSPKLRAFDSYALFVYWAQRGLFVLAGLSLAVVLLFLFPLLLQGSFNQQDNGDIQVESGALLSGVSYSGRNEDNRLFNLTARYLRAGEISWKSAFVASLLRGEIEISPGKNLKLSSDDGRYDPDAQTIVLEGNVTLEHRDGHVLVLDSASANLKEGTIVTDSPVSVDSQMGLIRADRGLVYDSASGSLKLKGRTSLVLYDQNSPRQNVRENFWSATGITEEQAEILLNNQPSDDQP